MHYALQKRFFVLKPRLIPMFSTSLFRAYMFPAHKPQAFSYKTLYSCFPLASFEVGDAYFQNT